MAPTRNGAPPRDAAKNARTFQCRDELWESLSHVATDLECTVDFLLNDAIKHYLRHRQRTTQPMAVEPQRLMPPAPASRPTPVEALTPSSQRRLAPPIPQPIFGPPPLATLPPLPTGFAPPPLGSLPPLPQALAPVPPAAPPPNMAPSFAAPVHMARPPVLPPMAPPPRAPAPPSFVPRPAPPPMPPALVPPPPQAKLVVTYGRQSMEVERAGFIIGRGKQASGLTIKDPNISRAHATVERHDGVYWLVDMGSTNGTLVNGQPIQRKPIAEGDVARICDHEIVFSYRR